MPVIRNPRPMMMLGLWAALTLMLAACAGPWKSAPDQLNVLQWTITPPQGWMHLSTTESEMLSKNGPYLEYILIQSRPLEKRFRFTKQKLDPGMLPHEAAQLITGNMRSDPLVRHFHLLSSQPATIGGNVGFKLIYSYQDQYGVDIKTIYYGVIVQNTFFSVRYTAAQRHYFEAELPAFNQLIDSLRFVAG